MMYDELIASLRTCIKCSDCKGCKFNEEVDESDLIGGELAEPDCMGRLMAEAADAIEELSRLHEAQRQNLIALMNEEPEPKWIPCSERLPDYDEEVLVADFCSLGWCMHVWYRTHDGKGTDYWEAEDGHFVGINYAEYWMPLPEPPKEESTNG